LDSLFRQLQFLDEIESGDLPVDTVVFDRVMDDYAGKKSIHAVFFRSYIRHSRNPEVQSWFRRYVRKREWDSFFVSNTVSLWAFSESLPSEERERELSASVSDSGKRDEGINLYFLDHIKFFEDELVVHVYSNPWREVSMPEEGGDGERSVNVMVGAPTNALSVMASRFGARNEEEFFTRVSTMSDFLRDKYGLVKESDVTGEGAFSRTGADRVIVQFGVGHDIVPDIAQCHAVLFLFSARENRGYRVVFFMNVSEKNHSYEIADELFNQLIYLTTLTYFAG
jgi:hypothetical protein